MVVPLKEVLQQPRQPIAQLAARVATHGFDLLREIQPVQFGIIDQLASRASSQQRRLLLGPRG
ncbi:MAG TPA: hypothetical protein VFL55_03535 [Acetobacteraceae bacterium]|nr:hypothetical protein [Acetobacteraceae bacterium]